MSVEIQWTHVDQATGEKAIIAAEKFSRRWQFRTRARRRDDWRDLTHITAAIWSGLLEALERRVQRSEGVTEEDVAAVRQQLEAAVARESREQELKRLVE